MDLQALERDIHEAVSRIFAEHQSPQASPPPPPGDGFAVLNSEPHPGPFTYWWPKEDAATPYNPVTDYQVRWLTSDATPPWSLTLATQAAPHRSHGRPRRRIVVFSLAGNTTYPLSEFVETDLSDRPDTYAAVIPSPSAGATPRSQAKVPELALLRRRFRYLEGADIRPTIDVFRDKAEAQTLRLICSGDDHAMMLHHALYVGDHRNKLAWRESMTAEWRARFGD